MLFATKDDNKCLKLLEINLANHNVYIKLKTTLTLWFLKK